MKNFALSLICVIASMAILSGCSSNENPTLPVIDIEAAYNNISEVYLSEYASSIDYIPLETGPASLVSGNIISMRLNPDNNKIVIYTQMSAQNPTVLAFGHDGKFISKIGTQGRSKDEYNFISTVISDEKGYDIIDQRKIVSYNEDGSFSKSIPIDHHGINFYKMADGGYIYLTENIVKRQNYITSIDAQGDSIAKRILSELVLTDASGRIHTAPAQGIAFRPLKNPPLLVQGMGSIYLLANEKDTIYRVNKMTELTPEYIVNYGQYTPGFYWNSFFFETEEFITSRALFNATQYPNIDPNYRFLHFIYNKKDGTTRGLRANPLTKSAGFTNDLDKGGICFYPIAVKNGKMYQLMDAIKFMEYAEQSSSQKMKDVAATLTEESNPVMIVVTLK